MGKIIVMFADGCEEVEALTTVDCLRRSGMDCTMVSINETTKVLGSHNIRLDADCTIGEVDLKEVDGIVLPGGLKGTANLKADSRVKDMIISLNSDGKLLAAICAAPSIYGEMGLLEGKKATSYPSFAEALTGAIYQEVPAVRDGNFITGRGMGASIDFALEIIKYFKDENSAKELANSIMFV